MWEGWENYNWENYNWESWGEQQQYDQHQQEGQAKTSSEEEIAEEELPSAAAGPPKPKAMPRTCRPKSPPGPPPQHVISGAVSAVATLFRKIGMNPQEQKA